MRCAARIVGIAALCCVALSGCATGTLATPEPTATSSTTASAAATSTAGPAIIVTVPDLVSATSAPVPEPTGAAPAPAAPIETAAVDSTAESVAEPADQPAPTTEPGTAAAEPETAAAPAPAGSPGDALNVSLANCDGCTVLATHRAVTGDLSAALVGTGTGRAILLSVAGDGQVSGVIGVPYGAAFPAPAGGLLACAQGRCVVEGRQTDGRAILSAFELTGTGAWRDVSGDDAFPSATEQAAVIDLDGELALAVQDQAAGAAVWLLYTWGGERYAVVGCSADGAAPTSVGAVSPQLCLS